MTHDDADAPRPDTPQPDEAVSPERQTPASSHLMSRRGFMSRSAQAAALSLFGVMGFDAVADQVLLRIEEISGGNGIASAAAHHLRESGLIRVARADCTYCPPADEYTCNQSTQPAFAGCGTNSYDFECQWLDNFHCVFDEEQFDCLTTYSCPPTVAGFTCFKEFACRGEFPEQDYICFYDPSGGGQFTCGGDPDGFLCPGVGLFHELDPCLPPYLQGTYECDELSDYAGCSGTAYHCVPEPGTEVHDCEALDAFECAPAQSGASALAAFICGADQEGIFCCNGTGTLIDFNCRGTAGESTAFDCIGQSFRCEGNHAFLCLWTARFQCVGSFACHAGGNQCGIGQTGLYSEDDPGDFQCQGVPDSGAAFTCSPISTFHCQAVDDFECGDGCLFECWAPFQGCNPAATSGRFECVLGETTFNCHANGGVEFSCSAARFSEDD